MQVGAQQHLNTLRFGVLSAASACLTPTQRESLLHSEREQLVADEKLWSYHPKTASNYQRAHTMFSVFLGQMFGDIELGWRTCRPDHVCLFLRRYLLPNLAGRTDGGVASTTLQGWVSALARCLELRGRGIDWHDESGSGNPARSCLVRGALRAYQQRQVSCGQRPRSAVPITPLTVSQLVSNMSQALVAAVLSKSKARVDVLLRDITHILYMWNSGRRGQDALYIDWEDLYIQFPDRSVVPVATVWAGEVPQGAPVGGALLMVPSRSKTEHTRRPQTQKIDPNGNAAICAIRYLRTYYQWQRSRYHGIPSGPVFLTQRDPPARMTAQAAGNRVRVNMRQYGEDHGETMHSFRRGHVQAAQAADESTAAIMQRTGMLSMTTFRKYSDPGRHLR